MDDAEVGTQSRASHRLRFPVPERLQQLMWFSRIVESSLLPRRSCLVWITGWGTFPGSENSHLFYRFRGSHGDIRLIHEAPGHLCLDYEGPEVTSLIYLSTLFGWDVSLIPVAGHGVAQLSHDGWVEFGFDSNDSALRVRDLMKQGEIEPL
jgi:hypothetical protein